MRNPNERVPCTITSDALRVLRSLCQRESQRTMHGPEAERLRGLADELKAVFTGQGQQVGACLYAHRAQQATEDRAELARREGRTL